MIACLNLFYIFFKIGMFAFGGGYVILPIIYQEMYSLSAISPNDFSNIVAISQVTPGPIAVNAAAYVGYKTLGFFGASFAVLGVITPSFIILFIISAFLNKFKSSSLVQAILSGIRPATVGMLASAVIFIAKTSIIKDGFFSPELFYNPLKVLSIPAIIIFAATFIASTRFKMGPIVLTLLAGVAGLFIF